MPPLSDGGDGDYLYDLSLTPATISPPGTGAVTVTDVNATLTGTSTIRVPDSHNNEEDSLYKHEYGHHRIAKYEYGKKAKDKLDAAARTVIGKSFPSHAAATTAAQTALNKAIDSIDEQMRLIQTKYDDVTDHGTSTEISANDAYNQITNAKDQAPKGGVARAAPDTTRPWAGVGEPPAAEFVGGNVHFTGDMRIDQTADPMDPLRNIGIFDLGNMIPIGLNENGTVMLSDANFAIRDAAGGVLVNGALFEASYGASEVPGFAGMIQASIWIAPQMWGGVDNTMGSPMLGEIATASNAGTLMTFWFLSDQALFNANAEPVATSAVTGVIKIGYTVPAPGSIAMLALGLTTCAWGLRRR